MNYQIVNQLTEKQILELVELYKNEFWSNKRNYTGVEKMLEKSDIIVAFVDENQQLIAFARVLTDFVYRATIYDVIVKPTHRKIGLGAKLLDTVVNHPDLKNVEVIALYCLPKMIPFYERWEFINVVERTNLMYKFNQVPKEFINDN
ncbi:MAG TPA: GNAT family N-acetyltransferase [Nostocaceae cyanobacterium]|nr:GNAT family N-acetyltransferase [Nostocaceae cyanobacterium]